MPKQYANFLKMCEEKNTLLEFPLHAHYELSMFKLH